MLERDAAEDLSGLYPFRNQDKQWCFTQRTAVVVGRKLLGENRWLAPGSLILPLPPGEGGVGAKERSGEYLRGRFCHTPV